MDRLLSAGGLNYFLAEKSRGCLVFSTLHNEILTFSALFEPTMSKKNVGGEGGYTRARMHSAHLPGHPSPPPHTHTARCLLSAVIRVILLYAIPTFRKHLNMFFSHLPES